MSEKKKKSEWSWDKVEEEVEGRRSKTHREVAQVCT